MKDNHLLSYVIPCSTPWANKQLKRIYFDSGAKNRSRMLSDCFFDENINITYGYLGHYARAKVLKSEIFNKLNCANSYILDHAYVPSYLKGSVFRVALADKHLSKLILHEKMLSIDEENNIYEHLNELSQAESVDLCIFGDSRSITGRNIKLMIKPSAVIELLQKDKIIHIMKKWKSMINACSSDINQSRSSSIPLISVKPSEVSLDNYGNSYLIKHMQNRLHINYDMIDCVYCPTSMMAINFILHSCSVMLSPIHPLYGLLGEYIPALPKQEAISTIMECIKKTSVSISNFSKLEHLLVESSKYSS